MRTLQKVVSTASVLGQCIYSQHEFLLSDHDVLMTPAVLLEEAHVPLDKL
jgi:hypothetical protein